MATDGSSRPNLLAPLSEVVSPEKWELTALSHSELQETGGGGMSGEQLHLMGHTVGEGQFPISISNALSSVYRFNGQDLSIS